MDEPDPVVDAARRSLDELMPILKEKCPGEQDQPLELPWPRWIPEREYDPPLLIRRYTAVPMMLSPEQQCAARLLSELRQAGLEPLAELDRVLAADPMIGPRLEHSVVSNAGGGGMWQASPLIQQLVDRVIGVAPLFNLPASIRDAMTTKWVESLRRPSEQMKVIVALHEFDAPTAPIELEPGLEIVELSEAEIAAALLFGGGLAGLRLNERSVSKVFGIRSSFESRLFIDAVPANESERETAVQQEAFERAQRVLRALRVFKVGRVSASGNFTYVVSWDGDVVAASGSLGPRFGWHPGEPYVLADEDVGRFREFWSAFDKVRARPAIQGALRRFGFAADRVLPDDEIVDLMIAAESLFLSNIGKRDRGEMRFRLSTRAASLLGTTLDDRLRIFKFMRGAYDARSAIVHGSAPSSDDLRNLDGERAPIHVVADDLERVLRDALQTAIRRLASGDGFPPSWEQSMFALPDT